MVQEYQAEQLHHIVHTVCLKGSKSSDCVVTGKARYEYLSFCKEQVNMPSIHSQAVT